MRSSAMASDIRCVRIRMKAERAEGDTETPVFETGEVGPEQVRHSATSNASHRKQDIDNANRPGSEC